MSIVVDTDVASFTFKEDSRSKDYAPHLIGVPKFISFMTLAEIRRWASQNNWGENKRRKLTLFLEDFGVIYADEELCDFWAKVMVSAKQNGRPIETADAWVAATALKFALPLVTHNRMHFEGVTGLTIISETT